MIQGPQDAPGPARHALRRRGERRDHRRLRRGQHRSCSRARPRAMSRRSARSRATRRWSTTSSGSRSDPIHNIIAVSNRVATRSGADQPGHRGRPDPDLQPHRQRQRRAEGDDRRAADRHHQAAPARDRRRARQDLRDVKNNRENYEFDGDHPSPWNPDKTGFIGVWDVTDNGDVPPQAIIKGPATGLVWPAGVAINRANREVYAIDSVSNALFMFSMPEFFPPRPSTK